jgi:hypothetical protein
MVPVGEPTRTHRALTLITSSSPGQISAMIDVLVPGDSTDRPS